MTAVTIEIVKSVTEKDAVARLPQRPVVFFDGVCGFCNFWVEFILHRDPDGKLVFAPLQGVTAEQLLPDADRRQLNSLVLWTSRRSYRETAAIVRILWILGGIWRIAAAALWLIPSPLRNLGYRLVARYRYRIFGKKDSCRVPTLQERSRILP